MPYKSPENVPLITYLWVMALSLWGGISSNIRKIRNGSIERFSITELVGDIVISGGVGLLTYFVCDHYAVEGMLSAVFVGISSHMGTRAIYAMEIAIAERLKLKIPEENQTKTKE